MKRSKMVTMMTRYYNLKADCLEQGSIPPTQFCSDMLGLIEELGMIPPKVEGKYDTIPTVTPTGNHDYSWIREWEPE